MTDQTKIPLPADGPGDGESLIERAVEHFGWGQFSAPPVPASFEPQIPQAEPQQPAPEPEVTEIAAVPAPILAEPAPEPVVVVPEKVTRAVVAPAPANFAGTSHPV